MILQNEEENVKKNILIFSKFALETLLCTCLCIFVHFYSNFLIFPIFFLVSIYVSIEYNRKIPYIVLICSGAIHDYLLSHFTGVYIIYFIFLYHGIRHFQRFIFKNSPFKEWAFFCGLCFLAFIIQSGINIFITLNNDWVKIISQSGLSFLFLSLSYPLCKIIILAINKK